MNAAIQKLTSSDNYFEDFKPGMMIRHARGKTVEALENVLITNLVMNTAEGHFNEHRMAESPFRHRITFGGVTASLIIGIASQDTAENALAELGLDKIRFKTPVLHGDTLYAFTEVLAAKDGTRADAGEVLFRHWGINQNDKIVFEGERRVLVKRRSHWAKQ
ncbi:MaoC family dehydratase [Noviherbaspirillum sp.]|uniref:MaoC family dehydratase n=1 Tax=Noviherbaspirillum sp. TaxID=1926288 RepID=UPI002B48CDEF|nr:MaoC family dehydratase [Noviherbaspirillum sp.]HJV79696.1 MaoC family dehydratase [Noviherbaspirillum sp.]